jgi:uncharacterized RDD family membrane protein YckC
MSSRDLEPSFVRVPKAEIGRRIAASGIDYTLAWLLSYVASTGQAGPQVGQWFLFLLIWLLLRTVMVTKNQGQSPGHWALDMKVVSTRSARLPLLADLLKREAAAGGACLLLLIGLSAWGLGSLICIAPVIVDLGSAMADPDRGQALHDRLANTVVLDSRRGYSLDLKLREWWVQARRNMQ